MGRVGDAAPCVQLCEGKLRKRARQSNLGESYAAVCSAREAVNGDLGPLAPRAAWCAEVTDRLALRC